MSYIRPLDRNQFTMMNKLDDLIRPDHFVRLLDAFVDRIVTDNLDVFGVEAVGEVGHPHYSQATMLKQYFYGYIIGVQSSRKLETEGCRNIELIWLLGTLSPDHWTIAHYRKTHSAQIKFAATRLRQFLVDNGYIAGDRMAVDGSKFKANASRDMLSAETIAKRFAQVENDLAQHLQTLATNDRREDIIEELDGDDAEREAALMDKIAKLETELDKLAGLNKTINETGQGHISPADPDARLMRSRDGKMAAYNVQIVVDAKYHFIADSEVLTDANDSSALVVMAGSLVKELGVTPKELAADAGYYTPDDIELVEARHGIACVVPPPRLPQDADGVTFVYDDVNDRYVCGQGKPLPLVQKNKPKGAAFINVYQGTQCDGCTLRTACTDSKHGRIINRYHNHAWRERFKERMKTYESRIAIAMRKCLVEHPFGTLKWLAGKIPLLMRGKDNVATEINLMTTAYNLKRLFNVTSFDTLAAQFALYDWRRATA